MKDDQDFQVILKSNSLSTKSYMESPFFFLSLLLGKQFLFVQNVERANEIFLRFNGVDPVQKNMAGAALLHHYY